MRHSLSIITKTAIVLLLTLLTAATAWAETVQTYYIDASGTRHDVTATVLTGSETGYLGNTGNTTYYVVNSDITFTNTIIINDVILILSDGKTMNVGTSDERIDNVGIEGNGTFGSLTIYGQANGTGHLKVFTNNRKCIDVMGSDYTQHSGTVTLDCGDGYGNKVIYATNVTINGGTLNATNLKKGSGNVIYASDNITINGGIVKAVGGGDSIESNRGNITLGWTNASDYIYADSYRVYSGHTVSVKNNQTFVTNDATPATVSGTISDLSTINGKTLTPDLSAFFTVSADGNTYTIQSALGWGVFCDMLQNNDKGYFTGKTVKLGASIEVSRMAGSAYHDFTGTFNGQGNTLTFTYNATEAYAAPFRYVEGPSATVHAAIQNLNVNSTVTGTNCRHLSGLIGLSGSNVDVSNCNVEVHITSNKGTDDNEMYPSGLMSQCTGPVTISGCTVTGEIGTNAKYAAGILGVVQGSATIAKITNCVSSVTINSSTAGDGTHGGFVAVSYPGSTTIEGCLFNGKLLTVGTGETATGNCGGFVGWRTTGTVTISNSLYAPATLTGYEHEVVAGTGDYPSATFVRNGEANRITNSYYVTALGTAQGKQATPTSNKPANIGQAVTTYSVSGIAVYTNGLSRNGLYYCSSPEFNLTAATATIFGESKNVGSFFSSTLNYQLPEGAKAYTASLDGTKVVFHLIGEDSRVIPKNTAVIIVSDNESITFTPLSSTTVTPHAGNILLGSDVAIDKPASGTVYVLNIDNKTLGFYPFKGDKIPAGKAYYYVAQ